MPHSSIVGGSTADRLLNCPGSYQQIMALPRGAERPPSEFALEGSAMHEVMAHIMRLLRDTAGRTDLQSFVGDTVLDRVTTEDDIDTMILPALEALERLEEEYGGGFEVMAVEQRVKFPGIPGAYGTCDLIMYSDSHVLHVDWKFGQGVPVQAVADDKVNAQLLFYVAAAMHTLPKLYTARKKLVAAIIQPRSDTPLSHTVISRKEIKYFIEDMQAAVVAALDRDPRLHRGEHCRWCPAKIACPLWTGPMLQLAAHEPRKRTEMVSSELTPYGQYLADAKQLVDMLTLFKRDIDEQLHAYLQDGGKVPGWRLKEKVKKRQWIDDEDLVEEVLLGLGFDEDEIWRSQLETFTRTDAVAKKLGVQIPSDLRFTPPTDETTICRDSDPAPEVIKPLAIEQFRAALQALVKA